MKNKKKKELIDVEKVVLDGAEYEADTNKRSPA